MEVMEEEMVAGVTVGVVVGMDLDLTQFFK